MQIEVLDTEHVKDDLSSSIADIFIKIVDKKSSIIFHLEFETIYRPNIVLRIKYSSFRCRRGVIERKGDNQSYELAKESNKSNEYKGLSHGLKWGIMNKKGLYEERR